MRLFSDVHGGIKPLRKLSRAGGPVLILGDLINLIDYRSWSGILPDVCGVEFVREMSDLRIAGRMTELKNRWDDLRSGREEELDAAFDAAYQDAYTAIGSALQGLEGYVTFGNVDRVDLLRECLPDGLVFVSAGTVEVDGYTVGIVGGGTRRTGAPGEIVEGEMKQRLAVLGPVDILCTHVPPLVPALATDVVAGSGKGSAAVLDYIEEHQPGYHYFGDVHQPRATTWDVGRTRCHNVGFFRATGRTVDHEQR
ncbi:hypothetical protein MNBD_ACTINO02-2728 [hydrothermal vent metagenome]|uniref:Calcineurin-like phosphoesterase domain-containing protein n=1 Tax=hydrothermal vent metagenome TaxID=652676 RepID=A0A3B0S9U3_9ZZZZ